MITCIVYQVFLYFAEIMLKSEIHSLLSNIFSIYRKHYLVTLVIYKILFSIFRKFLISYYNRLFGCIGFNGEKSFRDMPHYNRKLYTLVEEHCEIVITSSDAKSFILTLYLH